jgi:excisionase family DNA binding protein
VIANADLLDALVDRVATVIAKKVAAEIANYASAYNLDAQEPWRLWSVEDVCERLGRSRRSVLRYVKDEGLPVVHLDDGGFRFDPRDVHEWCESRRIPLRQSTAEPTKTRVTPESIPPQDRPRIPIPRTNGGTGKT